MGDLVAIGAPFAEHVLHAANDLTAIVFGNVVEQDVPGSAPVVAFDFAVGAGQGQLIYLQPVVFDQRVIGEIRLGSFRCLTVHLAALIGRSL